MENELLQTLICGFQQTVRDPLWKDIKLSQGLSQVFRDPLVQNLDGIRQLGPAALVYPGAVHTRLSHSLGVCHISRLMLISLLSKGCRCFSMEGAMSFLASALLHDLGHFPFAHSLKEVITVSHEKLGSLMIQSSDSLGKAISESGARLSWVCQIIDSSLKPDNSEIELYRSMLSGALDPDKLDYLCRDAFFCGVPYGVQDVSYIIDNIDISGNRLCISSASMPSIEHLLFSKYLMYRNVYWNRKVRSATAMIRTAITDAFDTGTLVQEDLFGLDDGSFFELCRQRKIRKLRLVENARIGRLYDDLETSSPSDVLAMEEYRRKYPGYDIIIDVPEHISFESDLLVSDIGKPFSECDQVFDQAKIRDLARTLRMARIFGRKEIDG
ncbi:MAG: HD domain-containing protein [Sphaerochaetaceae bacterium]